VLGESDTVGLADLPPEIVQPALPIPAAADSNVAPSPTSSGGSGPIISEGSWEEHEKAKIMEALQRSGGNITRAAQMLGMTFRTLQYRLEKFEIKR
jgi:transcriptional regulator with GAF, ATPase, and Fis domain